MSRELYLIVTPLNWAQSESSTREAKDIKGVFKHVVET